VEADCRCGWGNAMAHPWLSACRSFSRWVHQPPPIEIPCAHRSTACIRYYSPSLGGKHSLASCINSNQPSIQTLLVRPRAPPNDRLSNRCPLILCHPLRPIPLHHLPGPSLMPPTILPSPLCSVVSSSLVPLLWPSSILIGVISWRR